MKWIGRILAWIMLFAVAVGAYFTYQGYRDYKKAADDQVMESQAAKIRETAGFTPLSSLPETYINAVVAAEDKRYYKHPGVDVISIGRAVVNDIRAGKLIEGGSTITQQLAKNQCFTQEKSLDRKISEVFMAIKIEKEYSKEEILELYVNSIYFGNNYYGIGEAARGYFQVEPSEMTDYQSTILAGIPNAPSAYAWNEHPELARARQSKVLKLMVKQKYLTQQEADEIAAQN